MKKISHIIVKDLGQVLSTSNVKLETCHHNGNIRATEDGEITIYYERFIICITYEE